MHGQTSRPKQVDRKLLKAPGPAPNPKVSAIRGPILNQLWPSTRQYADPQTTEHPTPRRPVPKHHNHAEQNSLNAGQSVPMRIKPGSQQGFSGNIFPDAFDHMAKSELLLKRTNYDTDGHQRRPPGAKNYLGNPSAGQHLYKRTNSGLKNTNRWRPTRQDGSAAIFDCPRPPNSRQMRKPPNQTPLSLCTNEFAEFEVEKTGSLEGQGSRPRSGISRHLDQKGLQMRSAKYGPSECTDKRQQRGSMRGEQQVRARNYADEPELHWHGPENSNKFDSKLDRRPKPRPSQNSQFGSGGREQPEFKGRLFGKPAGFGINMPGTGDAPGPVARPRSNVTAAISEPQVDRNLKRVKFDFLGLDYEILQNYSITMSEMFDSMRNQLRFMESYSEYFCKGFILAKAKSAKKNVLRDLLDDSARRSLQEYVHHQMQKYSGFQRHAKHNLEELIRELDRNQKEFGELLKSEQTEMSLQCVVVNDRARVNPYFHGPGDQYVLVSFYPAAPKPPRKLAQYAESQFASLSMILKKVFWCGTVTEDDVKLLSYHDFDIVSKLLVQNGFVERAEDVRFTIDALNRTLKGFRSKRRALSLTDAFKITFRFLWSRFRSRTGHFTFRKRDQRLSQSQKLELAFHVHYFGRAASRLGLSISSFYSLETSQKLKDRACNYLESPGRICPTIGEAYFGSVGRSEVFVGDVLDFLKGEYVVSSHQSIGIMSHCEQIVEGQIAKTLSRWAKLVDKKSPEAGHELILDDIEKKGVAFWSKSELSTAVGQLRAKFESLKRANQDGC